MVFNIIIFYDLMWDILEKKNESSYNKSDCTIWREMISVKQIIK